jgi:small subunit ribosomal protein S15
MARMHSGKRGKAGSKKPLVDKPQKWISYSPEEVEQLVVKISKTGKTSAQVGLVLRDTYGIPDVRKITSKKVMKILKENKIEVKVPEPLQFLIKKEVSILKHLEKNKHDMPTKRGLILTESKIRRLMKYYKRKGLLPQDWQHSRDQAKITI